MARPGTYEATLNKMLRANGLPPVVVPDEIPFEDLFGVKVPNTVGAAISRESVATGASGYQEEGLEDMMELGEGAVGGELKPKERREARPKDPRVEKTTWVEEREGHGYHHRPDP